MLAGYISPVHDGYKKPGLLPAAVRLDMLRFAVEDSGWVTVDDWECRQPDPSASYKVVEHVKSLLSANADMADAKILFVCGADLARDMENPSKWPVVNRRRLLAACTLAVMAREGTDVVTESYQNEDGEVVQHVLMSSDVIPGSSTLIR